MTLCFKWDWEQEPDVRLRELSATWCRLTVEVDGTPATLVERRDGSGGPRHGIDVSAYPLAEYLAINWWRLSTPSHLSSDSGVRFTGAGSGFAWPDLTLRSDHGLMWATLRHRDKAPEHVRFLTQAETVLEAEAALAAVSDFVDGTVRRLEDQGVSDTFLQQEWAAIQQADSPERDYCMVAAAWGQDPYDVPQDVSSLLIDAESRIGSAAPLADLARAVPLERLSDSADWLLEAISAVRSRTVSLPSLGPLDWGSTAGMAPWTIGYERARRLRGLLDLAPSDPAPVDDLLTVGRTDSAAPSNVDGLICTDDATTLAVVVGADASLTAQRFASARAIARQSLSRIQGVSLLTRAAHYTERAERAFAAELLAPAEGVSKLLNGEYGDDALRRVAKHYKVNPLLVQHQVENQVAA